MAPDNRFYAKILDYLNTAIVLIDGERRIQYANQAAEAVLALSANKARGLCIDSFFDTTDQEDQAALKDAIANAHPFTKRHAEIRDAKAEKKVVDYTVTPFFEQDGDFFLIEIQDMDRLIKISREESLIATHDASRQLIRGVAHEVKNPLGGILGAAQLLSSELADDDLREYTVVIADEAERLRNLVDRMLGPNQPPNIESLNIHKVLERVIALINTAYSADIDLVKDYDPSLPDIRGDVEQLIQATLNIAQNACQAMLEQGTASPQLTFKTRVQRRCTIDGSQHLLVIRVDICDNGPGIPEELVDDIFFPMITSRSDGTGLGLPIAQAIVSAHKGMIECQSDPRETCFSIYIPIDANQPGSLNVTATTGAAS